MRFVKYSESDTTSWITKAIAGQAVTPEEHRAVVASIAATMDTLIGASKAFLQGITDRAVYPKVPFHGDDPAFADKEVPVVGFQPIPQAWVDMPTSPGQSWEGDQRMWTMALAHGQALLGSTWRQFLATATGGGYIGLPENVVYVGVTGPALRDLPPADLHAPVGAAAGVLLIEQKPLAQRLALVLRGAMDFRARVIAFESTGQRLAPRTAESLPEARAAAAEWAQQFQQAKHRGGIAAVLGFLGIGVGSAVVPPLFGARMVRRPTPGPL